MPYRIASPPEPEPPETEHPYARVLRAQRRRTYVGAIAMFAVAGGFLAGVVRGGQGSHAAHRHRVDETTRMENARAAIAAAKARASVAQHVFEASVREAIGQDLVARPDLGACPFKLPSSTLVRGRSAFPLLTLERAEIGATLPSQAIATVLADIHRAEAHVTAGRYEEAALYARALGRPDRLGYDVVLLAKSTRKPYATSGSGYEPGTIEGRAYVYDFSTSRVVCAGDVVAKSSKKIGYVFAEAADAPAALGATASMNDAIQEDIRLQTERAIAEAVQWRAGAAL